MQVGERQLAVPLGEADSGAGSGSGMAAGAGPGRAGQLFSERGILWVRWFGLAILAAPVWAGPDAGGALRAPQPVRLAALALLAGLAAFNIAQGVWLAGDRSPAATRRMGLATLSADHAFLLSLAWLLSQQRVSLWTLLLVLPLEAAVRYQLVGAAVSVAVVSASEVARRALWFPLAWSPGTAIPGLAFRVGALAMVGVLGGLMVASLERSRQEARIHAAELAGLARARELQARHDPLTGLPNRLQFQEQARASLQAAGESGTRVAVMIMDLDRFREVNDTLGHFNGDEVLRQVAARLSGSCEDRTTVARLGGDEFGFLLAGVAGPAAALAAGQEIIALLRSPVVVNGLALQIEASLGVAVFPEHGDDADLLLQRADVAMYVTKQSGDGVQLYSARTDGYRPSHLTLMGELGRAIDNGELVLHWQPQVDMRTGRVCGAEGLVRWQHPVRGLLSPDEFIPLAERTGLIRPLTQQVLEMAVTQWAQWRREGRNIQVAANLSARNLHDPCLADEVSRLMWRWKVPPGQLELEITESSVMSDPVRALELLPKLRAMGVRLSIDDFGTGYSSFAHLKQMPLSQIKIDRSFVTHMTEDATDAAIVRATIDLAHSLGIKVVGEGIERRETYDALVGLGCDVAQGWWLSRALPAADLSAWMDRRQEQAPVLQPYQLPGVGASS